MRKHMLICAGAGVHINSLLLRLTQRGVRMLLTYARTCTRTPPCTCAQVRNINRMEKSYLQLLQYNTIISASQYAQYYFSLRHAVRAPSPKSDDAALSDAETRVSEGTHAAAPMPIGTSGTARGDNFRSKYFIALNVPSSARCVLGSGRASGGAGHQAGRWTELHVPSLSVSFSFRLHMFRSLSVSARVGFSFRRVLEPSCQS